MVGTPVGHLPLVSTPEPHRTTKEVLEEVFERGLFVFMRRVKEIRFRLGFYKVGIIKSWLDIFGS